MYSVVKKKANCKHYKKIKTFKTYDRAYFYLGDLFQVEYKLHWSYSIKYLMCGYDRRRLFKYGRKYFRRNNICFKIVEL